MLSFRTPGYNGYGVKYSPFFDNKLAVATSANYGLVGNGRLYILDIAGNGNVTSESIFDTQDGLFDLSWSEMNENHVAVASGDGSVKIFDRTVSQFPVMNWKEHQREVFSVNWNLVEKTSLVTSSWDGTIKIWTPSRQQSLLTLSPQVNFTTLESPIPQTAKPFVPISHNQQQQQQHQPQRNSSTNNCIYQASFSPHSPNLIMSCSGSSHVHIWDIRASTPLKLDFISHGGLETLTCDWNKYRSNIIATSGVDKSIKIWDLRMIQNISHPPASAPSQAFHKSAPSPLNEMLGHEFAVRKISWSPHDGATLLSCSYDMTSRVWVDMMDEKARFLGGRIRNRDSCKGVMNKHREFVIGCDWSLWGEPGWVATTGWDEMVYIWDTKRI